MGIEVSLGGTKIHDKKSINPKYLISGQIQQEFVISLAGSAYNNFLGGNLAYAFAGLRYWDQSIGLISRLSADFPRDSLTWFEKMGADVSGIIQKETRFEQRSFCAVNRDGSYTIEKALVQYLRIGKEFPKMLLNFVDPEINRTIPSYLEREFPFSYLHSELVLVLPEDLSSQTTIMSHLGNESIQKFILSPSNMFMYPRYWNDWLLVFKNLDVLLISEKNIQTLFNQPQKSLWDSIETLLSFGIKAVVVNKDGLAYWIMENSSRKRWIVPAYPIQAQYPLAIDPAFAGGFLYGYQESHDVLEGTLIGLVSSSLMAGGVAPASIFDALPGIADGRLEILRRAVSVL